MSEAGHRWLTPAILATQKAEIRRITAWSQPEKIVQETLSRKALHKNRTSGVAQGEVPEFKRRFWSWFTSVNMMSSNCIHLPSNHMSLYLMAKQYSIHILISSTFTYYVMQYYWYSVILFSFPSFPEFQSSSTATNMFYIWVCIWSCLLLFLYLSLDLSSTYERKHVAFVFLILPNFT
jgi:hypothetical protein